MAAGGHSNMAAVGNNKRDFKIYNAVFKTLKNNVNLSISNKPP